MLVDSHCHLDFPELRGDLAGLLARMADNGVTHALTISTTLAGFPGVLEVARSRPNLWCTAGVHPDERGDGREATGVRYQFHGCDFPHRRPMKSIELGWTARM